jgi:hypothetical protein
MKLTKITPSELRKNNIFFMRDSKGNQSKYIVYAEIYKNSTKDGLMIHKVKEPSNRVFIDVNAANEISFKKNISSLHAWLLRILNLRLWKN